MSLINDALKKAQRQRGDESAPEPLPAGAGRAPRRDQSSGSPGLLVKAGIGIVAVCAIVVTTVVLMRQSEAPSNPAVVAGVATSGTDSAADPGPASTRPAAISTTPHAPDPGPQNPSPSSAGPIKVPDLTLPTAPKTEPTQVSSSAVGQAKAEGLSPQVSSSSGIGGPAPEAGQNKAILTYLSTLRVTGIRPAGADSKVLMNDRVYRLNDVVDYSLGLKLTGIAIQQLSFVDEHGVSYVKEF